MFGSSSSLASKDQKPMGQDARRSATNEEARALPLLYGRQRLGCTYISDFFDIRSEAVESGGKNSTKTGTNYYASFAVAVCHGPVSAFHDLYLNGEPVFASATKLYAAVLSQANNIATFQTKNPHGLATGDTVVIHGANEPEFNGEFTITVVSDQQFQYVIPGTTIASETATSDDKIYALVKLDPILANGADSTSITIPDYGTATIHWGTEGQPADTYLTKVSGITHPPYKGICYIVFRRLFLGFNQTNAQNVEVVVERLPAFDWLSAGDVAEIAGDANPACIMADLLLNARAGLALVAEDVNLGLLATAADQFWNEGVGLSPLVTRAEELRTQLLNVLEIVDGSPVIDSEGKIAVALQRPPAAPLIVTDAQLVDLPTFGPGDWSGVINETRLTFIDRDSGWQNDFVEWKDNAGIYAKTRPEPQTLDRPSVTHRDLALKLVALAGQVAALPQKTGKLTLAFEAALFTALAPGNAFKFQYSQRPALNGVYRVLSRQWPDPAQPVFDIEVAIDRSYLYAQALADKDDDSVITPQGLTKTNDPIDPAFAPPLQDIFTSSRFAILELPPALCPGKPALTALVARESSGTTNATLWLGRNYDWLGNPMSSFVQLATVNKFAWHGVLLSDYPADTNVIDMSGGLVVQLDGPDLILPETTPFDALCDKVLVFVGDEILSVTNATLIASGLYRLAIVRGRCASPIEAHATGDLVLLATRETIVPLTHPHFQPGNVAQFKLTFGTRDVSDADSFEVPLTGVAWRVPPPCAVAVNGRTSNAVFNGAVPMALSWILPDAGNALPRSDLVQVFTLLEFVIGGSVSHSEKVSWPANNVSIPWATLSALPPQNFTLRATTLVRTPFMDVPGWSATLEVVVV